ncbi:hypothetical protein AG1IA_08667 [Rhizoctonia solani AG-1 IA]|uniref:Uncharacterized protein n=1 Tax=Thanatephorus cucumeris (strain AG1-IA) TaxID=983506 RepID=L8WKI3_THACA|nr:hypothetical protein AG1IA_08667 [Rhizoctonia solani AG-1 IA]
MSRTSPVHYRLVLDRCSFALREGIFLLLSCSFPSSFTLAPPLEAGQLSFSRLLFIAPTDLVRPHLASLSRHYLYDLSIHCRPRLSAIPGRCMLHILRLFDTVSCISLYGHLRSANLRSSPIGLGLAASRTWFLRVASMNEFHFPVCSVYHSSRFCASCPTISTCTLPGYVNALRFRYKPP